MSALHNAANNGHVDVRTLLLENNALVNQLMIDGKNALYLAVNQKKNDTCNYC